MSFHPVLLCSVVSKYPDNLAWYFGTSPLSVDVSWEREGRALKREGRGRSERAIQGTCPLSPSEHGGGGGAHALRETHLHTHTHSSSSRIFTARSSDWQQQTELRASTTEGGRKRAGNKGGIHWGEERTGYLHKIAPFFSSSSLGAKKGISPVLWTCSAAGSATCYGSPVGTWEHSFPLISLLSSLDYHHLGSVNPPKSSLVLQPGYYSHTA